jgi:hypothetical protein
LRGQPSYQKGDQVSLSSFSDSSSNISTFEPPIEARLSSFTDDSSPRSTIIEKDPVNTTGKLPTSQIQQYSSLIRTKSKYISSQETKSRKLLRKQKYDENDADDVIYDNDLPLVFNVPIIKNYGTLYQNNQDSDILRNHLLADSKYPQPTPLPGKLSQTDVAALDDESKQPDSSPSNLYNITEDVEITKNIQQFYNHRSISQAKLLKSSRDNQIYKLPQFIKSQSSMEDLQLISPEKLNCVDQSRPINLPPKLSIDKTKHHKQFHQFLNQYESNNKHLLDSKLKSLETSLINQQAWIKVYEDYNRLHDNSNKLLKKFDKQRHRIRKLSWESNIPHSIRYRLFIFFLTAGDVNTEKLEQIKQQYETSNNNFDKLLPNLKSQKDYEFDVIIDQVMSRPLYNSILNEVNIDLKFFKSSFKYLLYVKSVSSCGLQRHDEVFSIPICLILFGKSQTLLEIYTITELINLKIFNRDFLTSLNNEFNKWGNNEIIPHCVKDLNKFDSLTEFENFNCNRFWDILLQLNDCLPLSLSAPSTPILNQGGFPLLSPNNSQSSLSDNPRDETREQESITNKERNSCSLQLMIKLLQTLIIHACSPRSKVKNNLKTIQTFSLVIFLYYHFNWNSVDDLTRQNKSIKLNYSSDKTAVLDSFLCKWKQHFKQS